MGNHRLREEHRGPGRRSARQVRPSRARLPPPGEAGRAARGPSPIYAESYGKEPLRLSIWDDHVNKWGGDGGTPRDIAQNYGAHLAVCAMFANEPSYFAQ
jgi:hypothetical protein